MKEKIFNEIQDILRKQCHVENEIRLDSIIQEDLGLDSINTMTLVSSIESKYDLDFDDLDEVPITIEDLVKVLEGN